MDPASPAPASAPASEPAPAAVQAPGETTPPTDGPVGETTPQTDGPVGETTRQTDGPVGETTRQTDGPVGETTRQTDVPVGEAAPRPDGAWGETGPQPAEAASSTQGRSLRDMVMSLGILIVPIGLLLIFYRVVLSGDAPVTVDPAPTIQEAQAVFPVAVPTGLGDDWHVTTAVFRRETTGATLRLGYADPDKDPIQLVESTVPAPSLLPAELSKSAKPLGIFRAPNGVWRLYDGRPGEQALVLADPSRTIIVVGRTDVRNLQKLAGSLS